LEWLLVRRYALLASLAGGLLGVLLALMSLQGMLDFIGPVERGLLGLAASAAAGVLVAPAGFTGGQAPSRGKLVEAALASALSAVVTWPVVYSMFS